MASQHPRQPAMIPARRVFTDGFTSDTNAMRQRQAQPKCDCCPYGYHIDTDFIKYALNARDGKRDANRERQIAAERRQQNAPSKPSPLTGNGSRSMPRRYTSEDTANMADVDTSGAFSPIESSFLSDSLENIMSDFDDAYASNQARLERLNAAPNGQSQQHRQPQRMQQQVRDMNDSPHSTASSFVQSHKPLRQYMAPHVTSGHFDGYQSDVGARQHRSLSRPSDLTHNFRTPTTYRNPMDNGTPPPRVSMTASIQQLHTASDRLSRMRENASPYATVNDYMGSPPKHSSKKVQQQYTSQQIPHQSSPAHRAPVRESEATTMPAELLRPKSATLLRSTSRLNVNEGSTANLTKEGDRLKNELEAAKEALMQPKVINSVPNEQMNWDTEYRVTSKTLPSKSHTPTILMKGSSSNLLGAIQSKPLPPVPPHRHDSIEKSSSLTRARKILSDSEDYDSDIPPTPTRRKAPPPVPSKPDMGVLTRTKSGTTINADGFLSVRRSASKGNISTDNVSDAETSTYEQQSSNNDRNAERYASLRRSRTMLGAVSDSEEYSQPQWRRTTSMSQVNHQATSPTNDDVLNERQKPIRIAAQSVQVLAQELDDARTTVIAPSYAPSMPGRSLSQSAIVRTPSIPSIGRGEVKLEKKNKSVLGSNSEFFKDQVGEWRREFVQNHLGGSTTSMASSAQLSYLPPSALYQRHVHTNTEPVFHSEIGVNACMDPPIVKSEAKIQMKSAPCKVCVERTKIGKNCVSVAVGTPPAPPPKTVTECQKCDKLEAQIKQEKMDRVSFAKSTETDGGCIDLVDFGCNTMRRKTADVESSADIALPKAPTTTTATATDLKSTFEFGVNTDPANVMESGTNTDIKETVDNGNLTDNVYVRDIELQKENGEQTDNEVTGFKGDLEYTAFGTMTELDMEALIADAKTKQEMKSVSMETDAEVSTDAETMTMEELKVECCEMQTNTDDPASTNTTGTATDDVNIVDPVDTRSYGSSTDAVASRSVYVATDAAAKTVHKQTATVIRTGTVACNTMAEKKLSTGSKGIQTDVVEKIVTPRELPPDEEDVFFLVPKSDTHEVACGGSTPLMSPTKRAESVEDIVETEVSNVDCAVDAPDNQISEPAGTIELNNIVEIKENGKPTPEICTYIVEGPSDDNNSYHSRKSSIKSSTSTASAGSDKGADEFEIVDAPEAAAEAVHEDVTPAAPIEAPPSVPTIKEEGFAERSPSPDIDCRTVIMSDDDQGATSPDSGAPDVESNTDTNEPIVEEVKNTSVEEVIDEEICSLSDDDEPAPLPEEPRNQIDFTKPRGTRAYELSRAAAMKKLLTEDQKRAPIKRGNASKSTNSSSFARGTQQSKSLRVTSKRGDSLQYITDKQPTAPNKSQPISTNGGGLKSKVNITKKEPQPAPKLPRVAPSMSIPRPKVVKYAPPKPKVETAEEEEESVDVVAPLRSEMRPTRRNKGKAPVAPKVTEHPPPDYDDDVNEEDNKLPRSSSMDSDESTSSTSSSTGAMDNGEPSMSTSTTSVSGEFEMTPALSDAFNVLNEAIQEDGVVDKKKRESCAEFVRREWQRCSARRSSDAHNVEQFVDALDNVSHDLLGHVVNMTDDNGNTSLHYAVSHSNMDVVSVLLDSKVCLLSSANNAGYTPVMLAALCQLPTDTHTMVVQRLFQLGDVNVRAVQHGQTALMLAVAHGKLPTARLLVEAGAGVNMQDEDGSTALMCAAEHGHKHIVRWMFTIADVDASIQDYDGSTALSIAVDNGHRDVAVLIYAHLNYAVKKGTKEKGEEPSLEKVSEDAEC